MTIILLYATIILFFIASMILTRTLLATPLKGITDFVCRYPIPVGGCCFVVVVLLSQYLLEYSCWREMTLYNIARYGYASYYILEFATIGTAVLFLFLVTNRIWLANFLVLALSTLLGLINYYSINLRNAPAIFSDVQNITTAADVIGDYQLYLSWQSIFMQFLFGCGTLLCLLCSFLPHRPFRRSNLPYLLKRDTVLLALSGVVLWCGYLAPHSIKAHNINDWSWTYNYRYYGYLTFNMQYLVDAHHIILPESYSEEYLNSLVLPEGENGNARPDIILILNESLSDMSETVGMEADRDPLEFIHNLENTIHGYAVVPRIGTGTNCSEYELLTSNTNALIPNMTPFGELSMSDTGSVVSLLSEQGYVTSAAHPAVSSNYNRRYGYSMLGFDAARYVEDFENLTYYGDRSFSRDDSAYQNLVRWYEETVAENPDSPLFSYLLTIQNHGEYRNLTDEELLIHNTQSLGHNADEYLTCVSMSDSAFADLITYFSQVKRPVIICMVGDHCPADVTDFWQELGCEGDSEIKTRETPFLIWSNYGLEEADLGVMSLNYVVPTLLQAAGCSLSPYLQVQLELREKCPVVTAFGYYYTADGERYGYNEGPCAEQVQQYLCLAYNNIAEKGDMHRNQWFHAE